MLETLYLVEICQHNEVKNSWNYKQTKTFTDLELAKKEFHNQLATFIAYGDLDHVGVILWDMYGNKIMSEYWHKAQPIPEEVEE